MCAYTSHGCALTHMHTHIHTHTNTHTHVHVHTHTYIHTHTNTHTTHTQYFITYCIIIRLRRGSAASSTSSTTATIAERNEELNRRPDHNNEPDVPAPAAPAQRRDNEQFQDNVAVNAGPGMADMGQNDFRRDWVDSFYKLFSFLLLMTLVYFSASLSKFLAFAIVIILLLM